MSPANCHAQSGAAFDNLAGHRRTCVLRLDESLVRADVVIEREPPSAMLVVREREVGTLERLMVTPVGRLEFLVGKMVPVACVGLVDVALITAVGVAWFGVPLRGDILSLVAASALLLLSTQGLGLLVSSYAATQQQAMMSAMFFVMPMTVLSGFAFPIRNMPQGVQLLTWVDPLRYYLVVVRDVFLTGGTAGDHPFEFAMMALLGTAAVAASATRVR